MQSAFSLKLQLICLVFRNHFHLKQIYKQLTIVAEHRHTMPRTVPVINASVLTVAARLERHLNDNRFSMMHYYMQNGDMMRDPDLEFAIDCDTETVNAVYFRQAPFMEQEVLPGQENESLQRNLNSFLSPWTKNIKGQEYLLEIARFTVHIQDRYHRVFFNPDGKEYQIGIGSLGNGVTIWNHSEEKSGDCFIVA